MRVLVPHRLVPVGMGMLLSPAIAAAMTLSSVSVIANALRLRGVRMTQPVHTCASPPADLD
jgi:cation transport ATPase